MRYKLTFVAGAAVGYVLGARAGRARYEQLVDLGSRLAATGPVQRARSTAAEQAAHVADRAKSAVGERVSTVVSEGRHRVEEALGDRMPDRLRSTGPYDGGYDTDAYDTASPATTGGHHAAPNGARGRH